MMGAFIQLNIGTNRSRSNPVGYIIQENGCWDWVGFRDGFGYGRWNKSPTGESIAHRAVYVLARGPIPPGLHIDHLCRNPACVRPDHLEPVTCRENLLRGEGPSAVNAAKTHCPAGHEYSGDNVRCDPHTKGRRGLRRVCLACRKERGRQACAARRALRVENGPANNAAKTHCPAGHEYAGDNLRYVALTNGRLGRVCRACHRERERSRNALQRAARMAA